MKTKNYLIFNIFTTFYFSKYITCFFLLLISSFAFSQNQTKAFPSAEGFGKFATGGRGGQVIKVTNLNDSGEGSLRNAIMSTSGPRTIIFEVGGTIELNSHISITNGNITVAGQTAPGDGILIKGSMFMIESSNVILRHLRFRPGSSQAIAPDGLNITAWNNDTVENIIVDHCSISWADDENLDIRVATNGRIRNITIQNSIIAEGHYGILTSGNSYNLTFFKNLFAHNNERSIHSNYPTDGTFDFEMINNLIYGFRWATGVSLGTKFTVLNNLYKKSRDTEIRGAAVDVTTLGQGRESSTDAYISGNVMPNGMSEYNYLVAPYIKDRPFASSGINPIDANQVPSDILSHVGASLPKRDFVDNRIVNQFLNENGQLMTMGSYPYMAGGRVLLDSDNDGMPDMWEIKNGLDPNDPMDRNYIKPDGYTNLEYYLNGMTLIFASAGKDVEICEGSKTTLTAMGGAYYQWSNGEKTASIEVSPSETTTFEVKVFDNAGNNLTTAHVLVTVAPQPIVNAGTDVNINAGSSVILKASGADSYSWNTGGTSAELEVKPDLSTTYTVVGSRNGCESIDSVTVNVIDNLTDGKIFANGGGDQVVVLGVGTTLRASGGDSYLWNTGDTTSDLWINPTTSRKYTVTVFDNTGKYSDKDEVNVTILSVSAGKDVTISIGENVVLEASNAYNYEWNTGEKTANITVSPEKTTTYRIWGNTHGYKSSDTVTVNVMETVDDNSTKVVASGGGDQNVVLGVGATLRASGGTSYLWNTGDTTPNLWINPTTSRKYTVTVFDSTGKYSDTDDVNVTILPVSAGKDVLIRTGESVVLTASNAYNYEWNTGKKTSSITVRPEKTTIYTVWGNTHGYESSDTVTVNVMESVGNSTKVVANGGGDQRVVLGVGTTLRASGGTSYLWNTGDTTPYLWINPTTSRKYTVTVFDSTGKYSDTDEVNVIILPVSAGKDFLIRTGESVVLEASNAYNYEWNTGEKAANITVSPEKTTIYRVWGNTHGYESSDTVTVTVLESVNNRSTNVISNGGADQSVVLGVGTTLQASGGSSYLWNTGATTENIWINPTTSRKYSVTVFDRTGKYKDTDEIDVKIIPVSAGKDVTIREGESVVLEASNAYNYEWNTGEKTANILARPEKTTTYRVMGNTHGYKSSDAVTITVLSNINESNSAVINSDSLNLRSFKHQMTVEEDLSDSNFGQFKVYPNPTAGEFHIRFRGRSKLTKIRLYDITGKTIYSENINKINQLNYTKDLDLSNFKSGIYILQMIDNEKVISKKIILN